MKYTKCRGDGWRRIQRIFQQGETSKATRRKPSRSVQRRFTPDVQEERAKSAKGYSCIDALLQHYASDATDPSSSCDRFGNFPSWAKLHRTLCDQPIIKRQISRGRPRSSKVIPAVGSTQLLFARWNAYYVSAPSFHPKYSAAHSLPSVREGLLAPSL
jgi:hypothetical protein